MRILVLIPTTAGALTIRSLRPRPALPASAAFAEGDYRPLPWSADYARLVGPHGPLAERAGTQAHELRLSGSFDTGRSWEIPVALAHLLLAQAHELVAEPAQAELVLWTTGALDLDLRPLPGRYALTDKVEQSEAILAAAPHARVALLLPPDEEREAALSLLRERLGNRLLFLQGEDLPEAVAFLAEPPRPEPALEVPPRRAPKSWALGLAALALTIGLAWAASRLLAPGETVPIVAKPVEQPGPAPQPAVQAESEKPPVDKPEAVEPAPASEPAQPKPAEPAAIIVEELRAPTGQPCRAVAFGSAQPMREEVPLEAADRFRPSRYDASLCGLVFRPRGGSEVAIELASSLRERAVSPTRLPGGGEMLLLRDGGRQNVVYTVQVSIIEGGTRKASASFTHALVP